MYAVVVVVLSLVGGMRSTFTIMKRLWMHSNTFRSKLCATPVAAVLVTPPPPAVGKLVGLWSVCRPGSLGKHGETSVRGAQRS